MAITPEQAQGLFDQGKINQVTFDAISQQQPLATAPSFETVPMPEVLPTGPSFELAGDTPPVTQPAPLVSAPVVPTMEAPVAPITPAAPAEPQFAPGTVVDTTSTQKRATKAAEEAQTALEESFQAQAVAAEEQAQVGAAKAAEVFGFNQEAQRVETEAANIEKTLRDKGNAEVAQRMSELDAKTAELSNTKYEGYWAKKSIGQKIVGAISLALGAYSASVGGGKNQAAAIIDGAMAEDFNAFQANTKIKLDAIARSRLSIGDKRRLTSDLIVGLQAKKLSDINVVKNKIMNLSNKFKGPAQKASLAQLDAQMDQKMAESRLKFESALADTVKTQTKRVIAGGKKALSSKEEAQKLALEIPGFGQARTKEEAIKFRAQKTDVENALAASDRITALGKDINLTDRKKIAKIKTELGLIQGSMRLALIGPGAVTDAEREFMGDLIGDPSKLLGLESIERSKLDTIVNKLKGGLERQAQNVIIGYGAKETNTPPHGNTVTQGGKTYKWDGQAYQEVI